VIRPPGRVRELVREVQQVAGQQDDLLTPVDQHAAMAGRVAGRVPYLDPGGHLSVLFVEVQHP